MRVTKLRGGGSTRCGLCARGFHGLVGCGAHNTWESMRKRVKHDSRYIEKGITVCERWNDFILFYEDMGDRPDGCSLDRIDPAKGYYKENCRWADRVTQARNRSVVATCEVFGRTVPVASVVDVFGLDRAGVLSAESSAGTIEDYALKHDQAFYAWLVEKVSSIVKSKRPLGHDICQFKEGSGNGQRKPRKDSNMKVFVIEENKGVKTEYQNIGEFEQKVRDGEVEIPESHRVIYGTEVPVEIKEEKIRKVRFIRPALRAPKRTKATVETIGA